MTKRHEVYMQPVKHTRQVSHMHWLCTNTHTTHSYQYIPKTHVHTNTGSVYVLTCSLAEGTDCVSKWFNFRCYLSPLIVLLSEIQSLPSKHTDTSNLSWCCFSLRKSQHFCQKCIPDFSTGFSSHKTGSLRSSSWMNPCSHDGTVDGCVNSWWAGTELFINL